MTSGFDKIIDGTGLKQNKNEGTMSTDRLLSYFLAASIALYATSLLAMPIVYDTAHLGDSLFILNSGWRVFQGLTPGIDYNSFYGGLTAQYVALSFEIFGPKVHALDFAPLLQFASLVPLILAVMLQRSSVTAIWVTLALTATIILTRAPFEEYTALTELVSAHSFSYNRLGLALSIVVLLTVLLPKASRHFDAFIGLVGGIAIALALLTKWSFITILPPAILALALQRRGFALGGLLLGIMLGFFALDPTGQRFLGTLSYVNDAASAENGLGGLSGLIFKTQRVILSHFLVILIAVVALYYSIRSKSQMAWSWGISALLMIGGLGVSSLLMGPFGLIGHQVTLIAAVFVLICAENIRLSEIASTDQKSVVIAFAKILCIAVILPHLSNALLVTGASFGNRDQGLIAEGPMSEYLHRHTDTIPNQNMASQVATMISERGYISRDLEYLVFVDGLTAIQTLTENNQYGVIAEGLMNFEFATNSLPVVGYPLWARPSSPEILSTNTLPKTADIVLLLRQGETELGPILRERMGEEFQICQETPIWSIFKRVDSGTIKCANN
ncbi:MAG: hypothetical protein AB3N28_08910 [Kordiimonas sp.]